jgi:acetyl-CoA synthetase
MISHPAVAESAAVAVPHDLKGNAIHIFAILKKGFEASRDLEHELANHIVDHLGPIARPEAVKCIDSLPKTRSGKIMRRVLKARILGLPEGDLSTLEE